MKKLLFTLVAAVAGGVASAVAPTATFDGLTAFDPTKTDDGTAEVDNTHPGYWEIEVDTSSEPELTIAALSETDKYLQLNTGSTPLWRTFNSVNSVLAATNATLDAGAYATNGVVVSSDVKLTACTEWPTLTDFADEKLALFLFAPEEGDTSGKTNGLYAVGGAWVTVDGVPVFTNKAYRLNVTGNVTNDAGWATIAIKAYDNILNAATPKYPGFLVAVNGTVVSIATEEADYAGFATRDMNNTASTRYGDKELIPAADTGDFKGLGFQGEGGIDNVNLAAAEITGMADAVTMTANITNATVTWTSEGTVLSGSTLTFLPDAPVTFEVTPHFDILTVKYNNQVLTAVEGVYTIESPAANATLEVKAEPALFEANDTGYATFAEALAAALAADGKVTLLGAVDLGAEVIQLTAGTVVIDLNGKELSGSGNADTGLLAVIVNQGAALTIKDSVGTGSVVPNGEGVKAVWQQMGTLLIEGGAFDGAITTETVYGATTTITGGKFKVTEGIAVPTGKKWSAADEYGYYTLENAGPVTSTTVDLADAGTGANVEVPLDIPASVTEVTVQNVPQGFAGKVVIPSTVEKINLEIGQLKVLAKDMTDSTKSYEITDALMVDGSGKLVLNAGATVNDVPVKPALADGADETPFVVGETTEATVKTIPGLKYSLVWDSDLSFTSDAKGGTEPVQAKTDRLTLEDTTEKPTKRFYKVMVTK